LVNWSINYKINRYDHITLIAIKEYQLSFKITSSMINQINEGCLPISSILNFKSLKNAIPSLKYNNILFLDQLTSLDGIFLLKWMDTHLCYKITAGKASK